MNQSPDERRVRWFALGLGLLTLLLFLPTWSHQMLFWDDDVNVLQNPLVLAPGLAGLKKIVTSIFSTDYYPVTYISLAVDHWLWNGRFAGYHVTQTVLHAINAGLVLLLVWRWTKNRPVASLVACWFAWHPAQVESVAWIAERKNALGTCFVLLAWLAYLRAAAGDCRREPARGPSPAGCQKPRAGSRLQSGWRASAVFLFTLAALSHALVIVMPALLILYEVCIARTRWTDALRRTWLFFVPAGFAAWLRILGHHESSQLAGNFSSVWDGARAMLQALGEYLTTLVYPVRLNNFYVERPSNPALGGALVWAAVWAVAIWRERRWGWFAAGWFLIALLPVLQLVPHPTIRADRYLYLAMLGPLLLIALSLPARGVKVVGAAGAIWFAALTCIRLPAWHDGRTLWTDSVRKDPQSAVAHFSLAGYALGAADLPAAEQHARRAVELNPGFAQAHERLGAVLLMSGKPAEARQHLATALRLDPTLTDSRHNLELLK